MSHATQRLLLTSYIQAVSSTSRHQLLPRRIQSASPSSAHRLWISHRGFSNSRRTLRNGDGEERSRNVKLADATEKKKKKNGAGNVEASAEAPKPSPPAANAAESREAAQPEATDQGISDSDARQDGAAMVDELPPNEVEAAHHNAENTAANASSDQLGAIDAKSESSLTDIQEGGDIATILAHGDSEAHSDLREYARLAAWELPLLHKLKKPFEPPTASTPLRFRYTSYMGDEHPAAKKVVVEFKPAELPNLNEQQQINLIKLVGPRYNPEKRTVKMSCESFETPAQNKRYLGDLVQRLVQEAKSLKDTFADVPVDIRHHKQKPIYKFPEEWKITPPARVEEGKGMRGRGREKRERLRALQENGDFVDGVKIIDDALAALPMQRIAPRPGEKTVLGAGAGKAQARGKARAGGATVSW